MQDALPLARCLFGWGGEAEHEDQQWRSGKDCNASPMGDSNGHKPAGTRVCKRGNGTAWGNGARRRTRCGVK